MGAFILFLHNEVTFSSSSPTAPQIEAALQAVPLVSARATRRGMGLLDDGGFVGSARVTRRAGAFDRITDVGWLYSWDSRPNPVAEADAAREISDYVRVQADIAMSGLGSGWAPARTLPYDPAVNGPVEWWQSGTASRTNTRDAFDLNEQTGSNQSVDNPIGPTTNHAPDADPLGTHDPNSTFNKLLGLVTTVAWVGGGIALLVYVVGPAMQALTARKNPTDAVVRT